MATVSTMVQVHDMVSGPMMKMAGALNKTLSAFEQMQNAADGGFDPAMYESARMEIELANREMEEMTARIQQAEEEQQAFNDKLRQGGGHAENLTQKLMGAVGAFASLAAVQKGAEWVGKALGLTDIQTNVERQLQSVLNTVGAAEGTYEAIVARAGNIQGYSLYGDETMIGAAGELSTYIQDAEALQLMMETTANYAAGMSGGGALTTQQMIDYATQLGKVFVGAYDGITQKGFELTEAQKEIIENGSDMEAALVISDMINESWANLAANMANTPQGKLIQMSNLFGDMGERVGARLYPAVLHLFDTIMAHSDTIEQILMGAATGVEWIIAGLALLADGAAAVYGYVADNWSFIAPIIFGVATALGVYYGAQLAANAVTLLSKGIHMALAAVQMMQLAATGGLTAATAAQTAAQYGLNAAMYANPIVWIIVLVIALIALIFILVAGINYVTGSSISAIGVICGALAVAGAFVANIFITLINFVLEIFAVLMNFIAAFANFFANVFNDPVGAIARLFFDLVDAILSLLQVLVGAIDFVFGTNLASGVQGWRDGLSGWVDETFGQGEEIMAQMNPGDWSLGTFEYGDAWDSGYNFGAGIDDAISNFDISGIFDSDVPGPEGYMGLGGAGGMADDMAATAGNTGRMADALDISNENLKYMRDLAEREAINRFTTAEIRVEMSNQNTIAGGGDVDGIVNYLAQAVEEALVTTAEGVHA